MANRCPKCKQKLQGTEFLCPNCGHILGQSVYHAPRQKPQRKIPWRTIFGTFGVLMLICAVLAAAWGIQRLDQYLEATGTTPGPTAPPTTAAPLTSYHVQLTSDAKHWISGITVHFCRDGQELYSGQVEADGRITFVAPMAEGYYIRLSGLFPALDYHYADVQIPFRQGDNVLSYHLETKDVEYEVRVVNSRGEPVKDVLLEFIAQSGTFYRRGLTEEDSAKGFTCAYDPKAHVRILYVPNGYVRTDQQYTFEDGSFTLEIRLMTYEECNIAPEHIYTARFVDENGDPIKDMLVDLISAIPGYPNSTVTLEMMTNQEGCIVFDGPDTYIYSVRVSQNPDYFDKLFSFEPGTNEQTITLHLHSPLPEYTYTVTIVDQDGNPVEGVKLYCEGNNGFVASGEDGVVTFASDQWDPKYVSFMVTRLPAGYRLEGDNQYSFPDNSRSLVVVLEKCTIEYNIFLYYENAQGITSLIRNAEVDIIIEGEVYTCRIDSQGKCRIELPYLNDGGVFMVEIRKLPEAYEGARMLVTQVSGDEAMPYISIRLSHEA